MDFRNVYEALKSPQETELLLADPKKTAAALLAIKYGVYECQGAHLASNLACLCTLLQVHPAAWNILDQSLVDKIVEIVSSVEQEAAIVCPAISNLALIAVKSAQGQGTVGPNRASIINSMQVYPHFAAVMVSRLTSTHVQTVQVTLQLINSLLAGLFLQPHSSNHVYCAIREAGLWKASSILSENRAVANACRNQLHTLQQLIKGAMKKTHGIRVDVESSEFHRVTFAATEDLLKNLVGTIEGTDLVNWSKAGLPEDMQLPQEEFNSAMGWAGLLDFNDFLSQHTMEFKKSYLEQAAFAKKGYCFPIMKASLAVTEILYHVFAVDEIQLSPSLLDGTDESFVPPAYIASLPSADPTNAMKNMSINNSAVELELAKMGSFRPLFFEWNPLHLSGVVNFMRVWKASSAEYDDFDNIKKVMEILFEMSLVAERNSAVSPGEGVLQKLKDIPYADVRQRQLELIDSELANQFGLELDNVKKTFHTESTDFVREQRLRLLLRGDWFFVDDPTAHTRNGSHRPPPTRRYYIALSPSRKTLQYSEFPNKTDETPSVESLTRSVDLSSVAKVNVTPITFAKPEIPKGLKRVSLSSRTNYTKISLVSGGAREGASLVFYTDTPESASAWGDGLLMLKSRAYQSQETKKFIDLLTETKLNIQMLNITPADLEYARNLQRSDYSNRQEITSNFFYE